MSNDDTEKKNADQAPEETKTDGHEATRRTAREFAHAFADAMKDKMHSFIPGYGLLPVIKWGAISLGVVFGAAVMHYGADEVFYGDGMREKLETTAVLSGKTCGLQDEKRELAIYNSVQHDVKDTTKNSLRTIPFMDWVPVPKLSWMPKAQAYEALYTADKYDIALVPTGTARGWLTMSDGVEAVIYRQDGGTPVMAYKSMNIDGFQTLMAAVEQQKGVQDGALVLRYNDGLEKYETIAVAADAQEFQFPNGIGSGKLAENPCFSSGIVSETVGGIGNSITGAAKNAKDSVTETSKGMWKGLKDRMPSWPSWGSDETEEQPEAPAVEKQQPATPKPQ